ncbi:MAG: C4-type zinc ribbon domain-containing protein [Deltaproteobacteria bacterium]|nr:C4-type zinc ribbon domain-containing protein [Deltaproteobacteria bacterium]
MMSEAIQNLIRLSELDLQLQGFRKKLAGIPPALETAGKTLAAEEKILADLRNASANLANSIRDKDATSKVALDTIEKFKAHLKVVHNQKEYAAAQKQLDSARMINEQMQNEMIEARMRQEELEPKLKTAEERVAREQESFRQEETVLKAEQGELEEKVRILDGERQTRIAQVEPRILSIYTRLVKGGRLPAMVPVISGVCQGCSIATPPQDYNRMIADPDGTHTCPHCGRLTYYQAPPPQEETPKKAAAKKGVKKAVAKKGAAEQTEDSPEGEKPNEDEDSFQTGELPRTEESPA